MKNKIPKSPFATRLSGSAKETELRIRNIFQWKKGRPPIALFVLAAVVLVIICGNLVGFHRANNKQTLGEVYRDFFITGGVHSIELTNSDRGQFICSSESEDFYASFNHALEYIQSLEVEPKRIAGKYLELDDKGYDIIYLRHRTEEHLKLKVFDQYDSKVVAVGQAGDDGSSFAPGAKVYRLSKSFDMDYILDLFGSDGQQTAPESGDSSDTWIYKPALAPQTTVENAIYGQKQKDYTIEISINILPTVDVAETMRVRELWMGSELAQSRGWSDDLLQKHFVAVQVQYYAQYDHTKTFLDDGTITQFFYLIQDPQTNLWSIVENSSPNVITKSKVTVWYGDAIPFLDRLIIIDLPQEWAGKIGYISSSDSLTFVHLASREVKGYEQQGVLFWINRVEGFYPADYLFPQPGWCIAATEEYTIVLGCASDVQYPGDEEIANEYKTLFQPERLQIYYGKNHQEDLLYAVNNKSITRHIYRCDDVYILEDTPTHGIGTVFVPETSTEYIIDDCQFLLCDDGCDPALVVSRASQGYAPGYLVVQADEFVGDYRTMRFVAAIPETVVDILKQQGSYDNELAWIAHHNARNYDYLLELDDTHYAYIHVVKIGDENTVEELENEVKHVDEFIKSLKIEFSKN